MEKFAVLLILASSLLAQAQVGESHPTPYQPTGVSRVLPIARLFDQKNSEECYAFQSTETIESLPAALLADGKTTGPLSVDYIIMTKWKMWLKDAIVKGVDPDADTFPTNEGPSTYYFPGGLFSEYLMIAANGLPSETEYHLDNPIPTWHAADFTAFYKDFQDAATNAHEQYVKNPSTPIEQLMQPGLDIIHQNSGNEHSTTPALNLAKIFPAGTKVHYQYPSDPADNFSIPFFKTWTLNLEPSVAGGIPLLQEHIPSTQMSQNMRRQIDTGIPVPLDLFFFGNQRALSAAHGLIVMGYELNSDGQTISHWKVQSSWGKKYGQNGQAWFTDADLMNHVIDAWLIEFPSGIPASLARPQ